MKIKDLRSFLEVDSEQKEERIEKKTLRILGEDTVGDYRIASITGVQVTDKALYFDACMTEDEANPIKVNEITEILQAEENQMKEVIISLTGFTGEYEELMPKNPSKSYYYVAYTLEVSSNKLIFSI